MRVPGDSDEVQDVEVCESRGFHGPSFRTEAFDRMVGWAGFGVCLTCGSTRFIPTELERRACVLDRMRRDQSGATNSERARVP